MYPVKITELWTAGKSLDGIYRLNRLCRTIHLIWYSITELSGLMFFQIKHWRYGCGSIMINTYRYSFFLGDESIHFNRFNPAILMPGVCHERSPVRADLRSADLSVDPSRPGLQILEATDLLLRERTLFTDGHVVLFQVGCSAKGREKPNTQRQIVFSSKCDSWLGLW